MAIAVLILYGVGVTYKLITSIYFDAKKDYLTKLLCYCESISNIVAGIAVAETYQTELIKEFWKYYYGKLILVEDKKLEKEMVAFGEVLERTNEKNFEERRVKLRSGALAVSGACRDLIRLSWRSSIVRGRDLESKQKPKDRQQDKQQI